MKILQVTPLYHPSCGGMERHVQSISETLAQQGHEITVATVTHDNRLPRHESIQGVKVQRFSGVGPLAYRVPIGLFNYLLKERHTFDVVHAHNYSGLALLLAVIACRERTVISPYYHGHGHSHLADVLHMVYDPLATVALRWTSRVICLSGGEAEQVVQKLGISWEQITIIPSGITPLSEHKGVSVEDNKYFLLSVGRLEAYKRVDRIIAALPYLSEDYVLIIIGRGSERLKLEHLADFLKVRDRVQFLGHLSDEELRDWYHRARVVVSLSEGESFGIVVLEALASGCQVVCNNIPAFRDFAAQYPHTVSLVAPELPGPALAAVLRAAAMKPRQSAVDLQRYSWSKIIACLLRIYSDVAVTTKPQTTVQQGLKAGKE